VPRPCPASSAGSSPRGPVVFLGPSKAAFPANPSIFATLPIGLVSRASWGHSRQAIAFLVYLGCLGGFGQEGLFEFFWVFGWFGLALAIPGVAVSPISCPPASPTQYRSPSPRLKLDPPGGRVGCRMDYRGGCPLLATLPRGGAANGVGLNSREGRKASPASGPGRAMEEVSSSITAQMR
jgi:hypothetical protein